MLSRFFINRPIFASVLSILIVLAGGVCIFTLPIAQYPDITPPVVQVKAYYPGADPKVIGDTVASPIEQEVNGVERMLYMSSTSSSDGSYTLNVTFDLGTDVDMAVVLTQNRVATAIPRLPQEVQRQGVTTKKVSSALVTVLALLLAGESVRRSIPYQLRISANQRRAYADSRRGRRGAVPDQGLRHASVARPEQDGSPQHHHQRRG